MSQIIHGKNLVVKLNDEVIAACTDCSVMIDGDLIETASPTSGQFRTFIPGRIGWAVSSTHLVTHGIMLSAASLINKKVEVKFVYCENSLHTEDGAVMQGDAIINRCRIDAANGSLARGQFNFQGTGELKNTDNYMYLAPAGNDALSADGEPIAVRHY